MIGKILNKIGVSRVFLIITIIIYAVVALVHRNVFFHALSTFLNLFFRIIPVLIMVFGIIFLLNLFIEPKNVSNLLGKGAGVRGWMIAIFGGILSTGPIYLWYPLLSDLKEKGMRDLFIATFLYNRAVKIPLLPMMIFYFGVKFTVILTIYMVLFSMINGFCVERLLLKDKGRERE